ITLSLREAAEAIGMSHTHLQNKIKSGAVKCSNDETGKACFSIADLIEARNALGIEVGRSKHPGQRGIRLGIMNQKGGAGKTTSTLNTAHGLARRGLRVLMVDADPQYTLTIATGMRPDLEESDAETEAQKELLVETHQTLVGAFIYENHELADAPDFKDWNIRKAIRHTNWPNVDLVPANGELAHLEVVIALAQRENSEWRFDLAVRNALAEISDEYDVILIDTPPNLGTFAMSLVSACDALVIPMQPNAYDYQSTVQYLNLLSFLTENTGKEFAWIRMLITRDNAGQTATMFRGMILAAFPDAAMESTLKESEAVKKESLQLHSVFESTGYAGNSRTLKQAQKMVDDIALEIIDLCERTWASKQLDVIDRVERSKVA
ncbi:MAG: hypothetical protein AMS22_15650, partial [Thiotrichales bacterium SG8_50]